MRLHDPLERELPDLGLVTMQDAETGEQIYVDTHDRGFRRRFAAAAERREAELRAGFVQAGVDALELSTDDELLAALLRFADLRKQRSRLAAGAAWPVHLQQNSRAAAPGRPKQGPTLAEGRSPYPAGGEPTS